MGDIRDRDYAERLEATAPEAYYRRREFLQRTAMAAGLAAGLGTVLDPETLVAEAARKQRRVPLPRPRNMPIDTFVVLMMENRSFDHYLGWLAGADGRQSGLTYVDGAGKAHSTARLAPDFQGCAHPDPDHSWEGGRAQVNGGKMDGFLRSGDNDEFSIGYYAEQDLPFVGHAAKAFTTYDRFFCSLLASTYPNREYMHAAQSYGKVDNSTPSVGFQDQGFPDTTIFAALKARGVDSRYFFNDLPVSALWGQNGLSRSSRVDEYYQRAAAGTLPPLSFVDPSFANEGG
ncbi:MAG: phospholipase, partial [Frankiaceae bacterium]|nr:phospholipase [Frankiaceae bacterium]